MRYVQDKFCAKEKQSRPGAKNGRSIPIIAYFDNGDHKEFAYVGECARYLIETGHVKSHNINSVRSMIKKYTIEQKTIPQDKV